MVCAGRHTQFLAIHHYRKQTPQITLSLVYCQGSVGVESAWLCEWGMNAPLLPSSQIRQEMKNFGTDVTYDDRTSLPRTMSFLTEVHRLRPVATLGIPHAASADGTIGGYAIEKETLIIPNHWAMHNDPADWQSDPQVFDATRFLKLIGNDLTFDSDKARIVTPFSVGKSITFRQIGIPVICFPLLLCFFLSSYLFSFWLTLLNYN